MIYVYDISVKIFINILGTAVTFGRTSYIFRENDNFTGIIILLDQPSCVSVTVVVVPQEQSPVDASSKS